MHVISLNFQEDSRSSPDTIVTKKSFSFTLQVQIGTKRLQIEYTKESMRDDNNEKSFYSLQKKIIKT